MYDLSYQVNVWFKLSSKRMI